MFSHRTRFSNTFLRWAPLLCILAMPLASWGQLQTQQILLKPGWNAVFIEVDPDPGDTNLVFQGVPVESVWGWNKNFRTVQYVIDPDDMVAEQPEWLTWFPTHRPESAANNLFAIDGARAYLIKLAGTQNVTLSITGRPIYQKLDWQQKSFNLVGFPVDPANAPTFTEFFSGNEELDSANILTLNDQGKWVKITAPGTQKIDRGKSYWIYADDVSDFTGPVSVKYEQGTGLDFSNSIFETTLKIENESDTPRTVHLRKRPSAVEDNVDKPAFAGDVVLAYYAFDPEHEELGWRDFPAVLELTLAAHETLELKIAVLRSKFAPVPPERIAAVKGQRRAGVEDNDEPNPNFTPYESQFLYQSLIEVSEDDGLLIIVPVTARGRQDDPEMTGNQSFAGLWVGTVEINKVRNMYGAAPQFDSLGAVVVPGAPFNPNAGVNMGDAPQTFQFRIIVHVDDEGHSRLLQQAIQMFKEGTSAPSPDDPDLTEVVEGGRPVLITDETLLDDVKGVVLRDGRPVGRRVSTAAFSFEEPLLMAGDFGTTASQLLADLDIGFDDRLNPFKHKYHPDHDNLNALFEPFLDDPLTPDEDERIGIESYDVKRKITLTFTGVDPLESKNPDLMNPRWLDKEVGGVYQEIIEGLHKEPVHVEGTFRLQLVSKVPKLNDLN